MASKHDETIATYLMINKTTKHQGVTANAIAESCDIPIVSVYRVLREPDNAFFQSQYPTRPAGYYFDESLAAETLHRKIDNSISVMMTQQKAADLLKRAEKAYESITPIGKHFTHITLENKDLEFSLLSSLKDDSTKYPWTSILKGLSETKGKDQRLGLLLRSVHMVDADLISTERLEYTVPKKYAFNSIEGFDDDKYTAFLIHNSIDFDSLSKEENLLWGQRYRKSTVVEDNKNHSRNRRTNKRAVDDSGRGDGGGRGFNEDNYDSQVEDPGRDEG